MRSWSRTEYVSVRGGAGRLCGLLLLFETPLGRGGFSAVTVWPANTERKASHHV